MCLIIFDIVMYSKTMWDVLWNPSWIHENDLSAFLLLLAVKYAAHILILFGIWAMKRVAAYCLILLEGVSLAVLWLAMAPIPRELMIATVLVVLLHDGLWAFAVGRKWSLFT